MSDCSRAPGQPATPRSLACPSRHHPSRATRRDTTKTHWQPASVQAKRRIAPLLFLFLALILPRPVCPFSPVSHLSLPLFLLPPSILPPFPLFQNILSIHDPVAGNTRPLAAQQPRRSLLFFVDHQSFARGGRLSSLSPFSSRHSLPRASSGHTFFASYDFQSLPQSLPLTAASVASSFYSFSFSFGFTPFRQDVFVHSCVVVAARVDLHTLHSLFALVLSLRSCANSTTLCIPHEPPQSPFSTAPPISHRQAELRRRSADYDFSWSIFFCFVVLLVVIVRALFCNRDASRPALRTQQVSTTTPRAARLKYFFLSQQVCRLTVPRTRFVSSSLSTYEDAMQCQQ